MKMETFINDNYRLLKFLYDNQTVVLDKKIIPLTQLQISEQLEISKGKTNAIFKELIDSGFLIQEVRGKYVLSDSASVIIEGIMRLENKLEKVSR